MTNRIKVRRPKFTQRKYFGEHDEKWARGGGRYGYGRMYGRNKNGPQAVIDLRSKVERQYADDADQAKKGTLGKD